MRAVYAGVRRGEYTECGVEICGAGEPYEHHAEPAGLVRPGGGVLEELGWRVKGARLVG